MRDSTRAKPTKLAKAAARRLARPHNAGRTCHEASKDSPSKQGASRAKPVILAGTNGVAMHGSFASEQLELAEVSESRLGQ